MRPAPLPLLPPLSLPPVVAAGIAGDRREGRRAVVEGRRRRAERRRKMNRAAT